MSRRKILIAGGNFGTPFVRYMAQLTGKPRPKLLYLPTASADSVTGTLAWYRSCAPLNVEPSDQESFIASTEQARSWEEVLLSIDGIVVSGGNTLNQQAIWKAQGIDVVLRQAWDRGIVLGGASAGSLCWFEEGTTDSRPKELSVVQCLGFLKGSHCPHYDAEPGRRPLYTHLIETGQMKPGYACDNNAGIYFEDNAVKRVVSSRPGAKAYYVSVSAGKAVEKVLEPEAIDRSVGIRTNPLSRLLVQHRMRQTFDAIRYALRQLRGAPVFTGAAVLTLALGIGGTTAIFTLIRAVMLTSLPVVDPETLFRIGDGSDCCVEGSVQDQWGLFSYPLFKKLRAEAPEFEQVTAFQAGLSRLSVRRQGVDQTNRPLIVEYVTGEYFQVFGVGAFGGRVLTPKDDTAEAPPTAVLSYHAWQTAYGSDKAVVGAIMAIEGHPFTIAGVAPPGFFGETLRGNPPDLWIPLATKSMIDGDDGMLKSETSAWLRAIGRLKPGATTAGLSARLTGYIRNWIEHDAGYPANWMPDILRQLPNQHIDVVPAGGGVGLMKEQYKTSLQLLFAVCGVVLLIACANVANLMLARAVTRRTQTAVRLAMGASRATLIFQALVEAIVLALIGAAAGLVVAVGASRLLLALAFANVQFLPISTLPSPSVLIFATGLALVTGVIFGAAPAWFATRTNPIDALRGVGRVRDGSSVARKALLVVQATLSVVLVTGATLLARTLNNLEHQNFGFDVQDRIVVSLARPPAEYDFPKLSELYRRLEDRLTQIPGVTGAGLALYNPLTNNWGEGILVQGHPPPKPGTATGASWDRVSANYMQNFGMKMVRGRAFTTRDNATASAVAVVNEAFVKRFFSSDENPIGMHFGLNLPENAGTFEVVGIVRDAKFAGFDLDKPARPMFFVPLAQYVNYASANMQRLELTSHFIGAMALVTSQPVSVMEPAIRRAMADVEPNLLLLSVRTMEDQVALSFNQQRAVAALATLFGAVALVLAAIGLYSVTAYTVAQQTNEIGVRMALGADRSRVATHVLRGAFTSVLAGLLMGLPLAVVAGRAISGQLYQVAFWDPTAMVFATTTLAIAALVASLIPAMKAAAISPTSALRAN